MGDARDSDVNTSLAAILLAAGGSRRLGAPKQLLEVDGTPMVVHAVRQAIAHCDAGMVVVTGAAREQVIDVLAGLPIDIVDNPDWELGMGTSIGRGVAAASAGAGGLLLLVCDQPVVGAAELAGLVAAWRAAPECIAAAGYAGTHGVPAIFPARYRGRLMALTGDRGARSIVGEADEVTVVDMPAAAHDIDTPEDARRLRDTPPGRAGT